MSSSAHSESPFLASARHSDKVTYIQSWWRTLKVAPGAAQSFCCRGSEGKAGLSDRMWSRAPFKWGHQLTREPGTLQQENSEQAQSKKKPHCEATQLTAEFSFFSILNPQRSSSGSWISCGHRRQAVLLLVCLQVPGK